MRFAWPGLPHVSASPKVHRDQRHIKLGDEFLRNEIPIPLSHKGIVELGLESWNDEVVLIAGNSAELELIGEPKYVEEFRP